MKPARFAHANSTYAEDQPEYLPLPAHKTPDGIVTSCWTLSFKERLRVLIHGQVFLSQMTFNQPLQPVLLDTEFEGRLR